MSPPTDRTRPLLVRYRLDAPDCAGAQAAAPFDAEAPLDLAAGSRLTARAVCAVLPSAGDALPAPIGIESLAPPIVFCRALDGWVFIATPSHKAWRGLCMTFLNRDVARRFDRTTAWESREVLDLVGLVLGTYACDDLDGRCATFTIPCVTAADGRSPTDFPILYGAITGGSAQRAAD